ncbi:inactive rhomboid protein 2-like, partial [Limulus polyphemus]|uniref:Inactive rhomboid protein 2-like n=1 Tax=Limulus polyphemus TaxID=6850 RepID=A0ABM1BT58_LIMPO
MDQAACLKNTDQKQHKDNTPKLTTVIENPMYVGDRQGIVPPRPPMRYHSEEQRPVSRQQSMKQKALARSKSVKEYVKKETVSFFGLNDHDQTERERWAERRNRLLSRRCGGLKHCSEDRGEQPVPHSVPASFNWGLQHGTEIPDRVGRGITRQSELEGKDGVHKNSVCKMTWDGLIFLAENMKKKFSSSRSQNGRPPQRKVSHLRSVFVEDDQETSKPKPVYQSAELAEEVFFERPPPSPEVITDLEPVSLRRAEKPVETGEDQVEKPSDEVRVWYRPSVAAEPSPSEPRQQIWERVLSKASDNSNRREYGMGVVGNLLKRSFRKDRITSEVKEQLDDIEDS